MAIDQAFPIISTMAVGIGAAFLAGLIASRLRLPKLVGYLLAGVALGPYTPGMAADIHIAEQFSEIGIIMLMFGVGLHFSFKDLMRVRTIAIIGAVGQIACATAMGVGLALWLGWSLGTGLVFGLALSVASTVVLLRELKKYDLLNTDKGRIAVGWLLVEDMVMIFALLLIPIVGSMSHATLADIPLQELAKAAVGVVLFFVFMMSVVRPLLPWVLKWAERADPNELFTLGIFAIAVGLALASSSVFNISPALGAFFAGMLIRQTAHAEKAEKRSLPFQDIFAVMFFVSVGMLFDPTIIVTNPLGVLATLAIVMFGKAFVAFWIVLAFRHPLKTGLTVSASLSQIGEFSFILAALGAAHGLLPEEGRQLIYAAALISIALNPATFHTTHVMEKLAHTIPFFRWFFSPWMPTPAPAKAPVKAPLKKAKPTPRRR